jgi:hypothetical protein
MAQAGIVDEVDGISDEVVINMTVPVNQSNAAMFGENNSKLRGTAVSTSGRLRLVKSEVRLAYPMSGKAHSEPRWGRWNGLTAGSSYRLSKETPLMPELNPSDPIAAIAAVRRIGAGGSISVRQVATKDGGTWYQVEAWEPNGTGLGSGWVNSAALMGQQLRIVRAVTKVE